KWLTDPGEEFDSVGDYSPDGSRFVFARGTYGDDALFVENTDGTGLHQITADGVDDERIDWSPDGSEILFAEEGGGSLYTVHPDGTGRKEIIHGRKGCPCAYDPTWSPDGTKIAYGLNSDGSSDRGIWTAHADGTHRVNITKEGRGEGWPSWGTHPL